MSKLFYQKEEKIRESGDLKTFTRGRQARQIKRRNFMLKKPNPSGIIKSNDSVRKVPPTNH